MRGSRPVTWGEVRVALGLSLVCAATAALLALPAGAAEFYCDDLSSASVGEGVEVPFAFRDAARMRRRQPFTVEFDWSTTAARLQVVLKGAWTQVVLLCTFPVCYVAYLDAASLPKAHSLVLGSALLAFLVASAAFAISGSVAFRSYSPVLGFALLIVALKLACPLNSKIYRHALKQALVLVVGNVLVINVIPETSVRTGERANERARGGQEAVGRVGGRAVGEYGHYLSPRSPSLCPSLSRERYKTDPSRRAAQDLVRFLQTFVLLNLYKETGRHFMVSAAYYLTVADLKNDGIAVNRYAAVAPVIGYQTVMSIVFRLEVSNYDDPRLALATCLLQGVLEVVLRLTAPERDAWVKRVLSRLSCAAQRRRATTLVVTPTAPSSPSSVLASKTPCGPERLAAADERDAVVKQFHARMILADMWGELAGIYIGSLLLYLGQSMPLRYPFRPYRKYPELFDGGNYYGELALGAGVQIVIEIITDTVCLVFEARRGLELLAVWRELPKMALTPAVLIVLLFGTLSGQVRSLFGDALERCNHRDPCWCVGNGLLPGGVREGYCLLLYANSSGLPMA